MIRNDLAALEARLAEATTATREIRAALDTAIGALTGEAPPAPVPLPSEPAPQPPALPPPDGPREGPQRPPEARQSDPFWMPEAWAEFGVRETSGSGHNPRVVNLFRDAGHPEVRDDETAWCAAFVGACLERSGVRSTRSLMARSYLTWGEPLGDRRAYGAIAVFSRGSDPSLGHVGFAVGAAGDQLFILGGNQSNAVSVQAFPRSRLLPDGLRWPKSGTIPDLAPPPADDNLPAFAVSLAHVLDVEGGWSDDPQDPGGATNYGITIGTYAAYMGGRPINAALVDELRAIRPETVRAIYLTRYWRPARCPELPPAVALFHFDCAVNQGVARATRFLQQAAGVEVDGEIGPITRGAAARAEPHELITRYRVLRQDHYRSLPTFAHFGRGWLNRLATADARARALIGQPSLSS